MNETKTLAEQVRSWKPRRPSARLERRLFGRLAGRDDTRAVMRVLVPAAACVILSVAMLNPVEHGAPPEHARGALAAGSLSNQSYAAYLPGSFACEANRLDTFGWTNGGALPSSSVSISPGKAKH